jgi:hypothetical protein
MQSDKKKIPLIEYTQNELKKLGIYLKKNEYKSRKTKEKKS